LWSVLRTASNARWIKPRVGRPPRARVWATQVVNAAYRQVDNFGLKHRTMFDWLDDVLNVSGDARLEREENRSDSPTPLRAIFDAGLKRDFDAAMELFAEDCVVVMEPDMEISRGKKACLGMLTRGGRTGKKFDQFIFGFFNSIGH
jgi:hypothetical protein